MKKEASSGEKKSGSQPVNNSLASFFSRKLNAYKTLLALRFSVLFTLNQ